MSLEVNKKVEILKKKSYKSLLLSLWKYIPLMRKRKILLLLIVTIMASIAEILSLATVVPFLIGLSNPESLWDIDFIRNIGLSLNLELATDLRLPLTLVFIFFACLAAFIKLFSSYINRSWAAQLGADLSSKIYEGVLYQSYEEQLKTETSEIITAVLSDIQAIINGVINPILNLCNSFVILLGIIFTLLYVSWIKSFISGSIIFLIYLISLFATRSSLAKYGESIPKLRRQVVENIQLAMGAIRDVILNSNQKYYYELHNQIDRKIRVTQPKMFLLQTFPRSLIEPAGIAVISIVGLIFISRGSFEEAIPLIGALALGAQKILPYSQKIYEALSGLNGAKPTLARVLIHLKKNDLSSIRKFEVPIKISFKESIVFKNVSFKYSMNSPWVLKNINLEIKKGERVGIVGVTGGGKSTLTDLIMGLLSPTSGQIFIDGVELNQQINPNLITSWRRLISHVPQNIYMSNSTIRENIAFGEEPKEINMDKVKIAAQSAEISEYIEQTSQKYFSMVGERGIKLSGGQRQRIGIARALYKECSLLVFDEATSALDSGTESKIINTINKISKEITVITIAHRISTIEKCNRIITIDNGKIILNKLN